MNINYMTIDELERWHYAQGNTQLAQVYADASNADEELSKIYDLVGGVDDVENLADEFSELEKNFDSLQDDYDELVHND